MKSALMWIAVGMVALMLLSCVVSGSSSKTTPPNSTSYQVPTTGSSGAVDFYYNGRVITYEEDQTKGVIFVKFKLPGNDKIIFSGSIMVDPEILN